MTKLCTYIITRDSGLAPNPYHGWCTLTVCTPNHMGASLSKGDWIAGFLNKARHNKLVYLFEVEERIHLNKYFNDSRFSKKKPDLRGDWRARCGDNFYSIDSKGNWIQHRNRFHINSSDLVKDTRRPFAFVGRRFWYFGSNALDIPGRIKKLVGTQGIRVNHDQSTVNAFLNWIIQDWSEGIHGLPNDNPDIVDRHEHPNKRISCGYKPKCL